MNNFTSKQLSDLLYNILSEIEDSDSSKTKVVLDTPTNKSTYPCRVISTPLENITKTRDAIPLFKTFQVSIEHWATYKRGCMDMVSKTDKELRAKNFIKTNTNPIIFDEITKKNRLITTYEVRYNAITNSFDCIR